MTMHRNNHIKMQTSAIPGEITQTEINEVARAIALYHCPLERLNWLAGSGTLLANPIYHQYIHQNDFLTQVATLDKDIIKNTQRRQFKKT